MPIRNAKPITYRPRSLSDALDGTNAPEGAMQSLANLIPDDANDRVFSCRPAALRHISFGTFDTPGFISGDVVIGDIVYGTIASNLTSGFDEPFVFNLGTKVRLNVTGITPNNVPASPPVTGAWTPPQLSQVGSRVIATHTGFSGDPQFTATAVGNTIDGSQTITGNPNILGVLPGMAVSGAGIPAGTTIVAVTPFQLTTVGDMDGTTLIDNIVGGTSDLAAGQLALGPSVPAGTVVLDVPSPVQAHISNATTITAAAQSVVFAGATITLSEPATASAENVTLTITGHPLLFGWFDVSGFREAVYGDTSAGSRVITGTPSILGVQPGMAIVGNGIPGSTTVLGTKPFVLVTTGLTVTGSDLIQDIANTRGVQTGMEVFGLGVEPGTVVVSQAFGSRVLLNKPVTLGAANTILTFTGATITISNPATASVNNVTLTIVGGTRAVPRWGAGDTDRNGLPSVPVGVARMNGRAYFACGVNGIPFSDSGFACRISNTTGVQALTTDDGLAITAIAPLMLSSPLVTTGVVAAIVVFEGVSRMQQITGDQATGNLAINPLNVATGTNAPNSICASEYGLFFISPHGLRLIDLTAKVSAPIGDHGNGVSVPFLVAAEPSRICAAANADVLRISAAPGEVGTTVEYWYDLTRQIWTGPHTFPASLIEPWRDTFIMAPALIDASLWRADVTQRTDSVFVENGLALTVTYRPVALPDTGTMTMNALVEMLIACQQGATDQLVLTAADISGVYLDQTTVNPQLHPTLWNQFNWNRAPWNRSVLYQQRPVNWNEVLIFKQLELNIEATASATLKIGNLYMEYEISDYIIDTYITEVDGFILNQSDLGGPDVLA